MNTPLNFLPCAGRPVLKTPIAGQPAVTILLAAMMIGLSSCQQQPSSPRHEPRQPPGAAAPSRDHFALALEFLKLRDEHNLERSATQVIYHLNQWIQQQGPDPRWMIDRKFFATLPLNIRNAPALEPLISDQALSQLQFEPGDVRFVEQARWLRGTAELVREQTPNPELEAWLQETDLPPKTANDLAICWRLFDWTIRNLQLDPLLPYPSQPEVGPAASSNAQAAPANWPAPMRGEPGPGYRYTPWHVLLYGHGDAWQRARVFILLARQLHLEAVMLGIDTRSGRARPWLPAVLLDGQLYLFDTHLGLPIPGPGGRGIATLTQVANTPALLTAMNVGSTFTYPVTKDDLSQVVALIDASPEYLSQRMSILEAHLPATDQLVLSVAVSDSKQQLAEQAVVQDVRLWAVPYETAMFQQAYNQRLAQEPELRMAHFMEHGTFLGLSPLVRARRQHLLGNLDSTDDQQGAKTLYLAVRIPDTQIEAITDPRKAEAMLGMHRDPSMSDAQWAQMLGQEKRLRTQGKQTASYFLGLCHMDNEDHAIAVNWFQKRTLDATPDGPWTSGARYNLARCLEQLGKVNEARKLYLIDESPQRHGNLLRVRELEPAASDSDKLSDPADSTAP